MGDDPFREDRSFVLPGRETVEVTWVGDTPVQVERTAHRQLPDGTFVEEQTHEHPVVTPSGQAIQSADQVAGHCMVCAEEGVRHEVAVDHAGYCERCGRLLCLGHQQKVVEGDGETAREVVFCPAHAIRLGDAAFGCLLLLLVFGAVIAVMVRGCL